MLYQRRLENNMIYYGKELYHYGTKGQKWGIRRYQNQDGSYTPEGQSENNGHGRYSNASENNSKEEKKLFNYKKAIKVGAIAVGATLAIIGGYEIYKNRNLINNYIKLGRRNVEFLRNSGKFEYLSRKSGSLAGIAENEIKEIVEQFSIKVKTISKSIQDDVDILRNNRIPDNPKDCGPLAIDFFLRRAGLDVTTTDMGISAKNGGLSLKELGHYISGLRSNNIKSPGMNSSQCIEAIKNEIINQCGKDISSECVGLINLLPGSGEGHFTSWYTENGEVKFIDIQKNIANYIDRVDYNSVSQIIVSRLDDCKIKGRNLFGSKFDSDIIPIIKNLV